MKIAILSRAPKCYSTTRLREASIARGHTVDVLDTLNFALQVEQESADLYYRGERLGEYDAVVPRIGSSITFYGAAVLRQFEQMGVFALNPSHAVTVSRDKLRAVQILSRRDIGIPATAFVWRKAAVRPAIERVGGPPVIIKLIEGTQGIGVILAESVEMAVTIVETLQSAKQNVLIQKFVGESRGRDLRALVVGGSVVAAMRRTAKGQEFRSNLHRGGKATRVELDREYTRTAVHAAQILGLRVAGVDILEGRDGPQVVEANSSPGLKGIETATGVDVAAAIIEHVEQEVLFPKTDLRKRMTATKGYSVAEFPVSSASPLAGRTIADSGLPARDIVVLQIDRGGIVIPNPNDARTLLAGDRLLCYGKLLALRSLVPQRGGRHAQEEGVGAPPQPRTRARRQASERTGGPDR